jgi:hypothetical protein
VTQIDNICSAAQRKFLGFRKQLNLAVFCLPRGENFGIYQQKQLKLTAQRKVSEFANTKATQIDLYSCSAAQRNLLKFVNTKATN